VLSSLWLSAGDRLLVEEAELTTQQVGAFLLRAIYRVVTDTENSRIPQLQDFRPAKSQCTCSRMRWISTWYRRRIGSKNWKTSGRLISQRPGSDLIVITIVTPAG